MGKREILEDAKAGPVRADAAGADRIDRAALIRLARAALRFSYAPYSGFSVSAALLGASGRVYTGVNIESAAYSPTICAERAAFCNAVSVGERQFTAIAIVAANGQLCPPCGVCRQVMREFCGPDFLIVMGENEAAYTEKRLDELLPLGFGPEHLA